MARDGERTGAGSVIGLVPFGRLLSALPFLVVAAAFLLLAQLAWQHWPGTVDPCGSASYAAPGPPGDFCGSKRTVVGTLLPIGVVVVALLTAVLGLLPVRPSRR